MMSDFVTVRSADQQWQLPLPPAVTTLGADASLGICVPHPEVAAQALTIDNRGNCPLVTNLQSFPIYLGAHLLEPGDCAPWARDEMVQLTRSVSLEITTGEMQSIDSDAGRSSRTRPNGGAATRQATQLAVIAACCLLAGLLLISPGRSASADLAGRFDTLWRDAERFETRASPRGAWRSALLESLQETRWIDLRYRDADPQRVIDAYRRLLQQELVRRPIAAEQELAAQIRRYSTRRIVTMWKKIGSR